MLFDNSTVYTFVQVYIYDYCLNKTCYTVMFVIYQTVVDFIKYL